VRTKRQINWYAITEYVKIEKHLEEMAAQGWMLKKAGSLFWKYEEMEPRKLHFSIVFFPKTMVLEPEPSENLLMFREFCEKTGWKLAAEIGQMQIFYNEAENPIPIETEGAMQLKNIHETAKTNVLLVYGILLANAVLQSATQMLQFHLNPVRWLSASYNIYLVLTWILLGIGSAVELVHYMLWYNKAQKIVEEEGELPEIKSLGIFRGVYLGVAFFVITLAVLSITGALGGKYGVYVLLWSAVMIGVPFGLSRLLKAMKVPAKANIVTICIVAVVTALLMVTGLIRTVVEDGDELFHQDIEMPLRICDLYAGDVREESESYRRNESLMLSYTEAWEHAECEDAEEEWMSLDYELVQVKADWVYDLCKDALIRDGNVVYEGVSDWEGFGFKLVDMPIWQADEVYQLHTDRPRNEFILCYEDMIIRIDFGWDVTEAEIQKTYETLQSIR